MENISIAERIERQAKLNFEMFNQQVVIAEILREHLTESLEWPVIKQLEARMYIGEHCGIAGIKTDSITCPREEFERRKDNCEL